MGETNWSEVSLDIPAGSHRVVWLYFKIKDSQTGDDTLWVDNVRWEPTSRLDVIVPDGTSSTVIEKIKAAATNAIPTAVAITVSPENLEKLELLDVTPTFTAGEGGTNAVDDIQVKFETALTFDPLTVTTRILDTSGMNPLTTTPAAQVVVYGRETLTNGWSQVGSSISEAKSSFSTTETGVDRLSDSRYKFFKFKVEPKLQQP